MEYIITNENVKIFSSPESPHNASYLETEITFRKSPSATVGITAMLHMLHRGKQHNTSLHHIHDMCPQHVPVMAWLSGNAMVSINTVAVCQARLLLGWVRVGKPSR